MYSVYKVENLINGRCYIGGCLTKQIPNNKYRHLTGNSNTLIARDLKNYSRSDFSFEVLSSGKVIRKLLIVSSNSTLMCIIHSTADTTASIADCRLEK